MPAAVRRRIPGYGYGYGDGWRPAVIQIRRARRERRRTLKTIEEGECSVGICRAVGNNRAGSRPHSHLH
jgi:hypothetical protein